MQFERWFGYALPEGYAASRALANICLLSLDASITAPFTRWLDDYRIFVGSQREGQRIAGRLARAAAGFGYQLSESKTRVLRCSEIEEQSYSSLDGHAEEENPVIDEVLATVQAPPITVNRERRLRLLLRLAAKQQDAHLLEALAGIEAHHLPASSLPRLSYALAVCPYTAASERVFCKLWELDDELAEWRNLRLAYVLWYWPSEFVSRYKDRLVEAYTRHEATRIPLIRVFAKHLPQLSVKLAPGGAEFASSRARYLAAFEGGKHPRPPASLGQHIYNPQAAAEQGPPIE